MPEKDLISKGVTPSRREQHEHFDQKVVFYSEISFLFCPNLTDQQVDSSIIVWWGSSREEEEEEAEEEEEPLLL